LVELFLNFENLVMLAEIFLLFVPSMVRKNAHLVKTTHYNLN